MTVMIKPAPVRRSVTVDAPIEKAFEVFTERFGSWWPAVFSIGKSPLKTALIERKAGGRWYEIGEDGSQCDWGEVLAWEPPSRLLLAWRIGADWHYDASLLTEVEVRFVRVDGKSTRVELEHRLLENMGEAAESARKALDAEEGWGGVLALYASEVSKAAG